jgi:hypothetical protein
MFLKYREVLDNFMRHLPKQQESDEVFRSNAELLFRACVELLRDNEEEFGEGIAVRLLNEIELGYACWLEDVREAIDAAREDFPPHYASFYERFRGASAMAEVYLLNLDRMEEKSGKKIVDFLKEPRSDDSNA